MSFLRASFSRAHIPGSHFLAETAHAANRETEPAGTTQTPRSLRAHGEGLHQGFMLSFACRAILRVPVARVDSKNRGASGTRPHGDMEHKPSEDGNRAREEPFWSRRTDQEGAGLPVPETCAHVIFAPTHLTFQDPQARAGDAHTAQCQAAAGARARGSNLLASIYQH